MDARDKTFFNHYGAAIGADADRVDDEAGTIVNRLCEAFPDRPLHEIEYLLTRAIACHFSGKRLERGVAIKRLERQAALASEKI